MLWRPWRRALKVLGVVAVLCGLLLLALWWSKREARFPQDARRLTYLGDVEAFLWSRTGRRLMLVRKGDEAANARWILDLEGGPPERWRGSTEAERAALESEFGAVHPIKVKPHVSPDGGRVAVGCPTELSVVDARTHQTTRLLQGGVTPIGLLPARWMYGPTWSPRGGRLAFEALETRTRLPRRAMERLLAVPTSATGGVLAREAEAWARLGARVSLYVLTLDGGQARRVLDFGPFKPAEGLPRPYQWLQWSPDGRRVGFIRGGNVWEICVPGGGEPD